MSGITEQSIRRYWDANPDADFDGVDVGVLLCAIDRLRALNVELLTACEAAEFVLGSEVLPDCNLTEGESRRLSTVLMLTAAIAKAHAAAEEGE